MTSGLNPEVALRITLLLGVLVSYKGFKVVLKVSYTVSYTTNMLLSLADNA